MTKREQFKNLCKEYLNDLAMQINFMDDEKLAEFANNKFHCRYCVFNLDVESHCETHCKEHVWEYLQEHGDEEVEE